MSLAAAGRPAAVPVAPMPARRARPGWVVAALDLVFPALCPVCGDVLGAGRRDPLCGRCWDAIPRITPVSGAGHAGAPPPLDSVRAAAQMTKKRADNGHKSQQVAQRMLTALADKDYDGALAINREMPPGVDR